MNLGAAARVPGASQAAIQWHYDVGNEFYALWLDPTLTYSCALWNGEEDLHQAQLNKLDWHLAQTRAPRGGRLLDVGCGWGSLLERAVSAHHFGHATGLSLSQAQAQWIAARQLPRVEVRLESWADHHPRELYDAIICIGALEHFARLDQSAAQKIGGYRQFFQFCHRVLRPGGRMSLQTITYQQADRSSFSPFFAEQVFPESDLPHLAELAAASQRLFEIEELRNDRAHYERTARAWLSRLRNVRGSAAALIGEQRVRSYERYLGLLAVGFHTGAMNLARMRLRRIDIRARGH